MNFQDLIFNLIMLIGVGLIVKIAVIAVTVIILIYIIITILDRKEQKKNGNSKQ